MMAKLRSLFRVLRNHKTTFIGVSGGLLAVGAFVGEWVNHGFPDAPAWKELGIRLAEAIGFIFAADQIAVKKLNDKVDEHLDEQ